LALYAASSLWGAFSATTPENFKIAFVMHGVFSGTYMTATASLFQRLLPRMTFAQFAAGAVVSTGICNIFVVPLAGLIMDSMHGDCRSIFFLGAIQAAGSFVATFLLYRAYQKRGGDRGYVPPGSSE
jgi:hypothetical protein